MTHNNVRVPFAASGMVAVNVKRLHAEGTRDIRVRHSQTQTVPHGSAKHLGGQATVRAIEIRWDRSYPSASVLCQQPCEALVLKLGGGFGHQPCVDRLVNDEGGLRL